MTNQNIVSNGGGETEAVDDESFTLGSLREVDPTPVYCYQARTAWIEQIDQCYCHGVLLSEKHRRRIYCSSKGRKGRVASN